MVAGKSFFTALQGILMLGYFRVKGYQYAFWSGMPAFASVVLLTFITYATMALGFGAGIVIPVYVLTLLLQLAYYLTISVSASKERMWIKVNGWYGLVLSFITVFFVVVVASGRFIAYHPSIEKLHGLILCASVVLPLTLVMNFRRELSSIGKEAPDVPDVFYAASAVVVIVALGFAWYIVTGGFHMKTELPRIDAAFQKVAEPFEPHVFVNDKGDSLNYRLLKPLDSIQPNATRSSFACMAAQGREVIITFKWSLL
jgi:hypothetical protein